MIANIFALFGRALRVPEIWANRTYRKIMKGIFTLVFGYLGIIWLLACFGGAASITMATWVFLPLFTFIYWTPRAGGLASLIEWFSNKDDPKKKSVWILYLLIVISAIVASSLAIILQQIGEGKQFPTWVLALLTIVVICLILPEKAKLDIWLPRIGAVVVALALFGTVMGAMGKWSANLYERTGYSVSVTPSKSSVAARKAIAENQRLADQGAEQCIEDWKKKNVGPKKVVREDQIAAAVAMCQQEWMPVAPSSQKEGTGTGTVGKKSSKPSYFSYNYWKAKTFEWSEEWGLPIGLVAIIVLVTVLLHFIPFVWGVIWGAKKLSNNETATKTVVVSSFSFNPIRMILYVLLIWALLSWYNGGWITSSADVSHLGGKISRIFEKTEGEKVKAYPSYFFTAEEVKTWEATGSFPAYHPNLGEIAGRSFNLVTGDRSGGRPNLYEKLESVWGKPVLIKLDENNPRRDVVLEYTNNCSIPLTDIPERVQTVCTGSFRSGDKSIKGEYELTYSSYKRVTRLFAVNPDGKIETIVFVFQPK
jgi:TM2 domain-containing membrane protein YozV